ncbi:GntR family transcriptional regulator [Verminephrobacter eiseniae]|uniref:Transcriptional regulator, GntR family n=1 Tax=Verminephrobacter eiseniae (strain EF01-2) TaxID=391735 RepID=A1WLM9_VEREI|nr:GntR family transcriptional regulator [Verminephrobacter eiseniae]ABM58536.1 transcriptional regulator, GntR family [Verminephrobacter eiseniae EF01-2]MCW5230190.1 FCD domain-containing protein [Verminephrobacter eiseniae]MCW5258973.1 FCD domain-containing protein [Verminephrobacter eiseniae]MCW5284113.1 FCD domain-containing protein [Verminephrobacter eiseniae]MCW5291923.1 FCD domain-containing protein [Verminephrobacter eiseniae]
MLPTHHINDRSAGPFNRLAAETPRTLAERAYLAVRQDIVHGRLAPGERLRVEHLKDRYAVGAGTLREALALLVSDALVTVEGQRGYRVSEISLSNLKDLTNTRVMLETEALRQSIRQGDAAWESELTQAFEVLTRAEQHPGGLEPLEWEAANKRFHEALISAHRSPWNKHLLGILYRHGERYRYVAIQMGAAQTIERDVHDEHASIYNAAMARQEARAALALEAHIRLTCDILVQHAGELQAAARQTGAPLPA